MNKRAIVGISLLVSLIFIIISGVYMYLGNHSYVIESLHHTFSIAFVIAVIFHFISNKKPLNTYAFQKKKKYRPSKIFIIIITATALLVLGVFYKFPLFEQIYIISESYAANTVNDDKSESINFVKVEKNKNGSGDEIKFTFKKGSHFKYPQYAIWIEDTKGNYLQTIFVTEKLANDNFTTLASYDSLGKLHFKGSSATKHLRSRPESLPVWLHQYKKHTGMDSDYPTANYTVPDAFSGATIKSDFILKSKTTNKLPNEFIVFMELNQSFDWNEFYGRNSFPNDSIYSRNGFTAQPSVIYSSSIIKESSNKQRLFLNPIGHGHRSGAHGNIIKDMSNITTALNLVDWIIIEI